MKKNIYLLLSILSLTAIGKNGIKVLENTGTSVTLEYNFSGFQQQLIQINNLSYAKIYADDCVPVLDKGYPQILRNTAPIAIPFNCIAKLEILAVEHNPIQVLDVAPSKGSLTRNINPDDVPYTFGKVYQVNAFYPSVNAELQSAYQLRHQQGINVSIYPVQVNPVTHQLKSIKKIRIKVYFENIKGAKMALKQPAYTSSEEQVIFENRFINLTTNLNAKSASYTPVNEFGSLLIISHPTFTNAMIPFVDWKTQKGIKTTMVTTAATGTTDVSIKTYIDNYYATNSDLLYVLIVGDHEQVRAFNAGTAGSETKWSDTKYGLISGNDWYPEVMVGRFSGQTVAEITTQVNRTLEYEKTPSIGNWWGKGIGIGSNEGYGIGDDGEPDWMHIRNIGNKLISGAGYNYYHEFYDSTHGGNDAPGDPTSTMVSAAVNSGAGIFLYAGHGSQNSCATSNYGISQINSATNYGKYPFSLQVACNNGTFIGGTCFSEAFVRASGSGTLGPKGAIASCGSSILMAWAEPMQTQDEIGDIISNQYSNNKKYTLGGLFYCGQMSMLDKYPTNTGKEVMETWVMFGDPSCCFRSAQPINITATHANCIDASSTTFSLSAGNNGSAFAALSQNNVLLGASQVNSGSAIINFTQTLNPAQPVLLTITDYNSVAYTQTLSVCMVATGIPNKGSNDYLLVQSLINDGCQLTFKAPGNKTFTYEVSDLQGKLIASKLVSTEDKTYTIDTKQLNKGFYLLSVRNETNSETYNVKLVKP